jgi:hypothetical protein
VDIIEGIRGKRKWWMSYLSPLVPFSAGREGENILLRGQNPPRLLLYERRTMFFGEVGGRSLRKIRTSV